MTPIPESGLDYLILSKEDAIALHDYFLHQYVHYDNEAAHAAVTKLDKFVERVEKNESSKANRIGSGESRRQMSHLRLAEEVGALKSELAMIQARLRGLQKAMKVNLNSHPEFTK